MFLRSLLLVECRPTLYRTEQVIPIGRLKFLVASWAVLHGKYTPEID
jgi:hypothetical protein